MKPKAKSNATATAAARGAASSGAVFYPSPMPPSVFAEAPPPKVQALLDRFHERLMRESHPRDGIVAKPGPAAAPDVISRCWLRVAMYKAQERPPIDVALRLSEKFPPGHAKHRPLRTMPQRVFPDEELLQAVISRVAETTDALSAFLTIGDIARRPPSEQRQLFKMMFALRGELCRLTWFSMTTCTLHDLAGTGLESNTISKSTFAAFGKHLAQGIDAFRAVGMELARAKAVILGTPAHAAWQPQRYCDPEIGWFALHELLNARFTITRVSCRIEAPPPAVAVKSAAPPGKADDGGGRQAAAEMMRTGPAVPIRALWALIEASVHSLGRELMPCDVPLRFRDGEIPALKFQFAP
jgi:hypothetical protein